MKKLNSNILFGFLITAFLCPSLVFAMEGGARRQYTEYNSQSECVDNGYCWASGIDGDGNSVYGCLDCESTEQPVQDSTTIEQYDSEHQSNTPARTSNSATPTGGQPDEEEEEEKDEEDCNGNLEECLVSCRSSRKTFLDKIKSDAVKDYKATHEDMNLLDEMGVRTEAFMKHIDTADSIFDTCWEECLNAADCSSSSNNDNNSDDDSNDSSSGSSGGGNGTSRNYNDDRDTVRTR